MTQLRASRLTTAAASARTSRAAIERLRRATTAASVGGLTRQSVAPSFTVVRAACGGVADRPDLRRREQRRRDRRIDECR
jgi:hypothetical protein